MTIDNKSLAKYVMFKLDKIENNFTLEELSKIEELFIDFNDVESPLERIDLSILNNFPNLKSIELLNFNISIDDFKSILSLDKLHSITFDRCNLQNEYLILLLKIKSLSLINCNIDDYSYLYAMKDLEELTVINGNILISKLNNLNNLKYLQMSNSNVLIDDEIRIDKLEYLYIDKTNIKDLNFINNLKNLKVLGISKDQYKLNQYLVSLFLKNGIRVQEEGIVDY